jgi:hypothetical protein
MLRRASVTSAVLIVLAVLGATPGPPPDPIGELHKKYPWGSIFLNYTTLADLHNTLNRKDMASSFAAFGDHEAFDLLSSFIAKNTKTSHADSAAFLQLDFIESRAAFMPSNVVEGTVTPVPWSPAQVRKVTLFVDHYLVTNISALTFPAKLGKGTSVRQAWNEFKGIVDNPLITPRVTWSTTLAFRDFLQESPTSLSELRQEDPELARKIDNFAQHVDQAAPPFLHSDPSASYWAYEPTGLLTPTYIRALPQKDGWSRDFTYRNDTSGTMTSGTDRQQQYNISTSGTDWTATLTSETGT